MKTYGVGGRTRRSPGREALRWIAVGGVLALVAAQAAPRARGQESIAAEFGETVEVHVVELDVVVTAGDRPVPGLGVEDFEVWEDGELRTVQSVDAVAPGLDAMDTLEPGAGPAAPDERDASGEPLFLLHAFEGGGTNHPRLVRAVRQVCEWVEEHPQPQTWQAVVLLSTRPVLVQPWTRDRTEVCRALEELPGVALGRHFSRPFDARVLQPSPEPLAGPLVVERERGVEAVENAADGLSESDRLWYAERSPLQQVADRLDLLSELRRQEIMAAGLAKLFGALATSEGTKTLIYYFGAASPAHHEPLTGERVVIQSGLTSLWGEVSDLASAAGFRVYGSSLNGLLKGTLFGRHATSAVTVDSLTFRPQEAARFLAVSTGGRSWSLNEQREILNRALIDHRASYRLAVVVPHGHDGERHEWRVRVARKGVELSYPPRYVDASPGELLLGQLHAPSTLFREGGRLPARLRVVSSSKGDDGLQVAIEAGVLAREVGLVPQGDGGREGNLEVYVGTYSMAGQPLTIDARRERFRLSGEGELAPDHAFAVERTVDLPATGGLIAVGFYDAVDQGTALTVVRVIAPPAPPSG